MRKILILRSLKGDGEERQMTIPTSEDHRKELIVERNSDLEEYLEDPNDITHFLQTKFNRESKKIIQISNFECKFWPIFYTNFLRQFFTPILYNNMFHFLHHKFCFFYTKKCAFFHHFFPSTIVVYSKLFFPSKCFLHKIFTPKLLFFYTKNFAFFPPIFCTSKILFFFQLFLFHQILGIKKMCKTKSKKLV